VTWLTNLSHVNSPVTSQGWRTYTSFRNRCDFLFLSPSPFSFLVLHSFNFSSSWRHRRCRLRPRRCPHRRCLTSSPAQRPTHTHYNWCVRQNSYLSPDVGSKVTLSNLAILTLAMLGSVTSWCTSSRANGDFSLFSLASPLHLKFLQFYLLL
jgi:hypothetical protein